jgi:hypothetical protein
MSVCPRLVIVVPLEGQGRIVLDAETFEDELALRSWLRRSAAFERLPAILERLLDDLDRRDEGRAA